MHQRQTRTLRLRPEPAEVQPVLAAAHLHAQTTNPDSPQRRIVKLRLVRNLFEAGLSRERIVEFFRLVDWVLRLSAESFALWRDSPNIPRI